MVRLYLRRIGITDFGHTIKMNLTEAYEINRGNWEHPQWEAAHWVRAADGPDFHYMMLDGSTVVVLKHRQAIRSLKPNTVALETDMKNLLAHPDLTPDAKKLMEKAIEAQATGVRPVLDFWI